MTCRELMTPNPAFCVPEDNVVRAAMLMKQHNVGSLPVVSDIQSMKLTGLVTDRDLTIRVIAEQRDYYTTKIGAVMTDDPVTCREDNDSAAVLAAMQKRQIRRIPVVNAEERLIGIISQADVVRTADADEAAETLQAISEPASVHAEKRTSAMVKTGIWVAGGLGLGAGLVYVLGSKLPRLSDADEAGQEFE